MTISTSSSTVTLAGNNVTTAFVFSFVGGSASYIQVIYTDSAGNQTVLTQGSQYTVTLNAAAAGQIWGIGGTVTYPLAGSAIVAGTYLTITRTVPETQLTSLSNQGAFYPQAVETELDLLEMQIQQAQGDANRAIQINPADLILPVPLPPAAQRAGQALLFDSTGQPTVGAIPTGAFISEAMQPFVESSSVTAATNLLQYQGPETGTVVRGLNGKLSDIVSAKDFGATGNGVTDDTTAINLALAAGLPIYLPKGTYIVTNALNCTTIGQHIYGDGIGATVIFVPATFNLSALGVFVMNGVTGTGLAALSNPGPTIRDMDIVFAQVDTATPGDLIQFPPAVYITNTLRWTCQRLRIMAGIDGIFAYANTTLGATQDSVGGGYIMECQFGCLNHNVHIDGATDSIRIDNCHFWPFGQTANQQTIFASSAIGVFMARVDDFHVSDALFFQCQGLEITTSANGQAFGELTNIDFDTCTAIVMTAGVVTGSALFMSPGADGQFAINLSGGQLFLGPVFITKTVTTTNSPVLIDPPAGATVVFTMSGGVISQGSEDVPAVNIAAASGSSAQVTLTGVVFNRTPNVTFTNPVIITSVGTAATLCASNCQMAAKGSGTGNMFDIQTDNFHRIIGNASNGWTNVFPTATSGIYQFN